MTMFFAVTVPLLLIGGVLAMICVALFKIANAIEEDSGLPAPYEIPETKQKPSGPAPRVGFGRREQ